MRRALLLSVFLLCLAVQVAFSQSVAHSETTPFLHDLYDKQSMVGKPAPHITLRSSQGDKLDLESLHGRPVLLTFWATYHCGYCPADLRKITALSLLPGVVSIAVDVDQDPAAAIKDLARTHNPIRNFHDDGRALAAFHLSRDPYARTILIDPRGRIVFSARSIFHDELINALAGLGASPSSGIAGSSARSGVQASGVSVDEIRALARQAVADQAAFFGNQEKYRCRYEITTRDHYDRGMSDHATQHVDEVFATDGHRMVSQLVSDGQQVQPDLQSDAASNTFPVWTDPVLTSVLDHSILSNITRYHNPSPQGGPQREYVELTFRGNPAFTPSNAVDLIAQSLEGSLVMDTTNHIFIAISGQSSYNVRDGNSFLLPRGMPILDFHAAAFEGVNLPSIWSVSSYRPVAAGPREIPEWNSTLARTFGQRESCQEYQVTTTILPGFHSVPSPQ